MNPLERRRKNVNGRWYAAGPQGGWIPEESLEATEEKTKPSVSSIEQPQSPESRVVDSQDAVEMPVQKDDNQDVPEQQSPKKPRNRKKIITWILVSLIALIIAAVTAGAWWYQQALQPVSGDTDKVRVTVLPGSSPAVIGQLLHDNGLIRSTLAFDIYTRLTDNRSNLQLGTYVLSPSQSVGDIVEHLTSGKVDVYPITIFSGETLAPPVNSTSQDGKDFTSVLRRSGFSEEQIKEALNADYKSVIFEGRPAGATLEGYIFPDTYSVSSSMTAQQFIQQTISKYEQVIIENDLKNRFAKQGLSLYEGITLASIIEKEMGRYTGDMPQVAQVFYTRLESGDKLGSDVTAYYGADLQGLPRAVSTDTPYNTRMHPGMPPGPIGMPSESALKAAANPAKGDYVYFLSGDDGKNYFAHTNEEHERNIVNHCQVGCSIP